MNENEYRYLVVGGGMTGDAVCEGIRSIDADGPVGLVGEEHNPPYKRPPLTKGLWSGGAEEKIWRNTADRGVDLHLGRRIVRIDPAAGTAVDDAGDEYRYEKLILATGGRARRLPQDGDGVVYYRTLDDYRHVRTLSDEGARFVVIGGGFIGSELAASLRSQGRDVTMVFPEEGVGWRTFPASLSHAVTAYYREKGIEILAETLVGSVEQGGVRLEDGRLVEADAVVAGLGIEPNVELAAEAGLPVDGGIVVDDHARVEGFDGVWAAGDVARFPIAALGRSGRIEHEDHANNHGRLAGANAAGADQVYDRLPFFYSDLFDLGYEAVGELDSRLRTVEVWQEPARKGVVAFVDDESRPRGVLLWNVWDKVDAARELITAGAPVGEAEVGGLAG
ncbi:MAG TPA: FAD-dependent oxidoreductase [Gaiellaceae bacterium]|nr:FAD-dependent oxidoreductase [Gaiellaceae bacterium]